MNEGKSKSDQFMEFRPSKTMTFWSCAAVAAATMAIGFGPGGWVTGGTAAKMVSEAARTARTELVANACVEKFAKSDAFAADLASLKKASSWKQGDIVADAGWATLAGMEEPSSDAARLCANQLVTMEAPVSSAKVAPTAAAGS